MEDLEILLVPLIIMGIVAAPFIWLLLRWSKSLSTCPVCKEKGAMNQTGNEEIREFTKNVFMKRNASTVVTVFGRKIILRVTTAQITGKSFSRLYTFS